MTGWQTIEHGRITFFGLERLVIQQEQKYMGLTEKTVWDFMVWQWIVRSEINNIQALD